MNNLVLPALEVRQGKSCLYQFSIDGKRAHDVAAISRIRREAQGDLFGYQRPEVLAHIAEIRRFIESPGAMVPNSIVLAFDSTVAFRPVSPGSPLGELVIPVPAEGERKPGFVVDGQQRLAAVRDAQVEAFPLCAVAFITDSIAEQTSQFLLVNSTKPLPKGLIYELLPSTECHLSTALEKRKTPARLLAALNQRESSPLRGCIQTPTCPGGLIKDNSILRMLENSLTEGLLYRLQDDGVGDAGLLLALEAFWRAVAVTWPTAWKQSPRKSRLMHGVGVVSLGLIMDALAEPLGDAGLTADRFLDGLRPLVKVCHWTEGAWDFGNGRTRAWNELQNTGPDIELVSRLLLSKLPKQKKARGAA